LAGGVVLGIRLGFHHHAPKQAAVLLVFHQQATNQLGGDQLGRAGEEGLGERWERVYGYGSGLGENGLSLLADERQNPQTISIPNHQSRERRHK